MRVRYQELSGRQEPYYVCQDEAAHRAGKSCQSIRAREVDAVIDSLLHETVVPAAIEVALGVEKEIASRVEQSTAMRLRQLERARYDADLARRRYMNVDPGNRMVADALESDWNARLRQLDVLQREHDNQCQSDRALLSDDARGRIRTLADDFATVWNDPCIESAERKRILGLLIEDVTLVKAEQIAIQVRFRGGKTTTRMADKPRPIAQIRKTLPEVVAKIDELLETCSDRQTAAHLNELGYKNWRGEQFTMKKVINIRNTYNLKSRFVRLRERGMLTAKELASQLGVSPTTIYQWGQSGFLQQHRYGNLHRCLFSPVGNVILVKGQGGRYSATGPSFIAVHSTTQGAI
ncbi:helix-turn-helix domain-containing protein [Salmonella enterica subsp. diarizonae]|nr:helix-turn-helix domain-containing protein [Salmonella enterica subsp. diarizonae]ECJ5864977.1 helix-turn-helix domain-containing protein [Salmonella enterica subsp. diarizonae]EEB6123833.1 helix-turn-helix domain-containing protein [Salmonella enterica subsp. diarizonae]